MSEAETLDMPSGDDSDSLESILSEMPDQIGPYKILSKLGEGGFGIVYEAQQEQPIKRRVALKVIKPGMDSTKVVARFEAERQALALMTHPSIAKVLDGGITDRGLPYFVMDLVDGQPITDFCTGNKLSIDDRLKILISVCQAIQHAHAKAVIHRDLKPSNILVGHNAEGEAVPTVIDFGIAKALDDHLTDNAVHTAEGQLIGTPEYMSPEQAEMSGLDIDTRTDVYSLGVVLYELLTGMRPFESSDIRGKTQADLQRFIKEVNPPKPSIRLQSVLTQAEKPGTDSPFNESRRRELAELPKQLRGELDWVVMKCLEKDRDRRYATPLALAEELEHYLNNEPVLARPPSTTYRMSKLVKRNKSAVAIAILFIGILLFATVVSVQFSIVADAERQRAVIALADRDSALLAEQEAKGNAERRAIEAEEQHAVAQSINEFLNVRLLGSANPDNEGRDVLVRDMLMMAADELDKNPPKIQRVEAALRLTIGKTFKSLEYISDSEKHLRRSLELWEQIEGPNSLATADTLQALAFTLMYTEKLEEAYRSSLRVFEIRKDKLGINDPLTLRSQGDVSMFNALRKGEVAGGLDDNGLDMARFARKKNESREEMRETIIRLILELDEFVAADQMDKAIALIKHETKPFLENRILRKRIPYALSSYSIMLSNKGSLRAAEALAVFSIQSSKELLKPDHSYLIHSLYAMSYTLEEQGRLEESQQYAYECIQSRRRAYGDDNENTIFAIGSMARLLHKMNRYEEAGAYFQEAIDGYTKLNGGQHNNTLFMIAEYAWNLQQQGKLVQAELRYLEAIDGFRNLPLGEYNNLLVIMNNLGYLYANMNEFEKAESVAIECYQICVDRLPPQHAYFATALTAILNIYTQWHKFDPNAGADTKGVQYQLNLDGFNSKHSSDSSMP